MLSKKQKGLFPSVSSESHCLMINKQPAQCPAAPRPLRRGKAGGGAAANSGVGLQLQNSARARLTGFI